MMTVTGVGCLGFSLSALFISFSPVGGINNLTIMALFFLAAVRNFLFAYFDWRIAKGKPMPKWLYYFFCGFFIVTTIASTIILYVAGFGTMLWLEIVICTTLVGLIVGNILKGTNLMRVSFIINRVFTIINHIYVGNLIGLIIAVCAITSNIVYYIKLFIDIKKKRLDPDYYLTKKAKPKLLIASNNKNKVIEITTMLGNRFTVLTPKDLNLELDVEETGTSFIENATLKAKAFYEKTGIPCLADDSGLCVDALDGAPGVYSAEYAIKELHASGKTNLDNLDHYSQNMSDVNVDLVLDKMKNISDNRKAKFVCVMAYYDGKELKTSIGETQGTLLQERQGTSGFGYDPIFYSTEINECFGTVEQEQKNKVSHRHRALESLVEQIS